MLFAAFFIVVAGFGGKKSEPAVEATKPAEPAKAAGHEKKAEEACRGEAEPAGKTPEKK